MQACGRVLTQPVQTLASILSTGETKIEMQGEERPQPVNNLKAQMYSTEKPMQTLERWLSG